MKGEGGGGVGDYLISLTSNSKEVLFENFKL